MIAVLDNNGADAAIAELKAHGETVVRLGKVVASSRDPAVQFRGHLDLSR
jgi:hypothetical protein